MRAVHKYEIHLEQKQRLTVPVGARFLHAGVQGDGLFVWALVDTGAPLEKRELLLYGTGHQIELEKNLLRHISTFSQGPYVWHVFERVGEWA